MTRKKIAGGKKAEEKNYDCEKRHKWKDFPYLIEGRQAKNWKPNEEIQRNITEKSKKNDWLKKAEGCE